MAAELFESVKVQVEHPHKPALVPTPVSQVNTLYTQIEDKYINLFYSIFSVPQLNRCVVNLRIMWQKYII